MTEAVSVLIVAGFMLAAGYAGFLVGRDAAMRQAGETIANLRRRCMGLTAQRDRLLDQNGRMARTLGITRPVDPAPPAWMSDDA